MLIGAGTLFLAASMASVLKRANADRAEPRTIQSELATCADNTYGALQEELHDRPSEDPVLSLHSAPETVIDKGKLGFLGSGVTGLRWVSNLLL